MVVQPELVPLYVSAIRVTCDQLRAELQRLRMAIDGGAELTPAQAAILADALRRVGLAAHELGLDPAAEL